jgi:hypothetical protein
MCVETSLEILIYNSANKGIVTSFYKTFKKTNIILSDRYVYSFLDGVLELFNPGSKRFVPVTNVQFRSMDIYLVKQYENILIVITKYDKLYKIFLDEVFSGTVKFTVQDVYSESFKKVEGMYQVTGIRTLVYYNYQGKDLNFIAIKGNNIKDVIQKDDVGIMTVINNGKLEYQLFRIDRYGEIKYSLLPERYQFTSNDKFIILLVDNKISFVDKVTLQEATSFEVDNIGAYSILFTNAGLVLYSSKKVLIINSK